MSKNKNPAIFSSSSFGSSKDVAVQKLLHYAQDHLLASRYLRSNPVFFDSAAYICNIAFELLFKAIHLAEKDQYAGIHEIIELHDTLSNKIVFKNDMPLLQIIDKYNLSRYPIENKLKTQRPIAQLGKLTYYIGEIGTRELAKADKLFVKIWSKLHRRKSFRTIIDNIQNNPYQKDNRILLRKRRKRI